MASAHGDPLLMEWVRAVKHRTETEGDVTPYLACEQVLQRLDAMCTVVLVTVRISDDNVHLLATNMALCVAHEQSLTCSARRSYGLGSCDNATCTFCRSEFDCRWCGKVFRGRRRLFCDDECRKFSTEFRRKTHTVIDLRDRVAAGVAF